MTHAVAPPALDRDRARRRRRSRRQRAVSTDPRRAARPRSRRHARPARLLVRRRRRLQPGVRRLGLPRATSCSIAVVGHGTSYLAAPAARAGRSSPSRWCSSCSRGLVAWIYYPDDVRRRLPARRRRGTPCAPTSASSATSSRRPSPPVRVRRRLGVPRRGDDGGRRVARRHVRLPRPGTRRGARARRRAVRVRRRARRRRAPRRRAACSSSAPASVALAAAAPAARRRPRTVLGDGRHPLVTADRPGVAGAGGRRARRRLGVGPHLPGADAEPLFDTHNDRGGVTEILSPLVDIRSRLVNQARHRAVRRCRPTTPSYWRAVGPARVRRRHVGPARRDPRRRRRRPRPARRRRARSTTTRSITIVGLRGALVPAARRAGRGARARDSASTR